MEISYSIPAQFTLFRSNGESTQPQPPLQKNYTSEDDRCNMFAKTVNATHMYSWNTGDSEKVHYTRLQL